MSEYPWTLKGMLSTSPHDAFPLYPFPPFHFQFCEILVPHISVDIAHATLADRFLKPGTEAGEHGSYRRGMEMMAGYASGR
jgi:hypothetical protein